MGDPPRRGLTARGGIALLAPALLGADQTSDTDITARLVIAVQARIERSPEAQAIAARLETSDRPARVSRWESSVGPVFDVTVFRFATLSEANHTALQLREDGYDPDLVVLPVEAR